MIALISSFKTCFYLSLAINIFVEEFAFLRLSIKISTFSEVNESPSLIETSTGVSFLRVTSYFIALIIKLISSCSIIFKSLILNEDKFLVAPSLH
jgi:hypothetical protein